MTEKTQRSSQEPVRINKWIAMSGYCSRREADRLIQEGRVLLDGEPVQPGTRVENGRQVTVDGIPLNRQEKKILLVVNKPRGVVCTTDGRWGDETLEQMVHYPVRVFSIGRLDKDSEGLILMTNQGDLMNKILKYRNGHEREYLVTVDRPVTQEFLQQMEKGVYLEDLDVTTRPCRCRICRENQFRITLRQGLNRQIRRMCMACGYRVVRLVRLRMMFFTLDGLKPGTYREADREEIAQLEGLLEKSEN